MTGTDFFFKKHNYQGRTDVAQCGLFTQKSVPVIFEPTCIFQYTRICNRLQRYTVYLYLETALRVSGGTSTHHQAYANLSTLKPFPTVPR
jgi:hypothetical protein